MTFTVSDLETFPTKAVNTNDSSPTNPVFVRVKVAKPSVPVVTVTGAVSDGQEVVAAAPLIEMYFELAVSDGVDENLTLTAFETEAEDVFAPILKVVVVFVLTVAVLALWVALSLATTSLNSSDTPGLATTILKVEPIG